MITWRKAELSDVPMIVETRQKAWAATYRGIYPDDWIDHFDYPMHTEREQRLHQRPGVHSYVVMDGDKCQGYFTFYFSEKPIWRDYHCRLLSLYLLPGYQGKGYGKKILSFVRMQCGLQGYDKFFLSCDPQNSNGMAFYRHMGGVVVQEDVGNENPEVDSVEFEFSCICCRKATASDARLLADTRRLVWLETYRGIYPDEKLDNYDLEAYAQRDAQRLADPSHHYYLFLEAGECVGYFSFGPYNFGTYKDFDLCLNNLYFLPSHQGRGLGKLAFQMLWDYCRAQKIDKFFCGCNVHNTPAMGFYRHMGGIQGDTPTYHDDKSCDIVHFEFYRR